MEKSDFDLIVNAIKSGECLAFLGAGACTPFVDHNGKKIDGHPTGGQLAETLAKQCGYPNGKDKDYDLLKVAQYFLYSKSGKREPLEKAIQNEIQKYREPRPIHTVLAQLKSVKIIITSNYDTLLERELEKYNRILTRHVYNPRNPRTGHFSHSIYFKDDEVILYKMHGTIEEPKSMVITQSDYISYLANLHNVDRGMPEFFRKTMMPQSTLLFLGYSLEDWNFQVIWEGVLYNCAIPKEKEEKEAYALVSKPTHFQKKYWLKKNVEIFDQDLTDFAKKLAKSFELDIPLLGIKNGRKEESNEPGTLQVP